MTTESSTNGATTLFRVNFFWTLGTCDYIYSVECYNYYYTRLRNEVGLFGSSQAFGTERAPALNSTWRITSSVASARFNRVTRYIFLGCNCHNAQTGKFPARFKSAQVLPLLKKAELDRSLPVNYRPISNLSTVSKVLERLVLARMRPHLTNSKNFSKRQSAYKQGH